MVSRALTALQFGFSVWVAAAQTRSEWAKAAGRQPEGPELWRIGSLGLRARSRSRTPQVLRKGRSRGVEELHAILHLRIL